MIKVVKPGLLSTVQDLGRYGFQRYGVIVSGSMDPIAHRISNWLVGNDENNAVIEMTLTGPVLQFQETSLISICGGDLSPSIDGQPVPLWQSVLVKKGSTLKFGRCKSGARSYLAIAGGVDVPAVMNSRSTYLRAEIGGCDGRGLKEGDMLHSGELLEDSKDMVEYLTPYLEDRPYTEIDWSISSEFISIHQPQKAIRVVEGPEYDLFTEESRKAFFKEPFKVSPQSDRMGYRLDGAPLALEQDRNMISEAVAFGTIQVPSDGNPIILLADRQTTGGYPRIGQIASIDLPLIAQTKPGEELSFTRITLEEAQKLLVDLEKQLRHLKQGIALKIK
ncbi:5-oxoprolinase subunit C family protein [Rossellomorea sp. NS-SX7]|uniref:5-oxoprolinase subunit C family protein n=1 Tax=Rossellomorea sp. NS-SX7 TaxID=3463856 RepID=UPI0040592971